MRAFNRVLSGFLAAVLVVAGVLTILEICRAALGQPPAVVQWPKLLPKLRDNSYDDAGPILVCIGLALVGLLIVISGVKRGKPYALPAGSTAPGVRTEINRRSLERGMQAAVAATGRVESGRVTLHRRSAVIVARANTATIDGLEADIRQRIEALLASTALVDPPRLKIKTHPAPPPRSAPAAQSAVGAGSATTQQPVAAGAQPASRAMPPGSPAAQEAVPARTPATDKPAAPPPASLPEPESKPKRPASQAKPARDPKPDQSAPPTTALDDLLSSDPEDER